MPLEPEGAGAMGCREFSLCACSLSPLLTCGPASQEAIAAGNERNNLKELKKKKSPIRACSAKLHFNLQAAHGTDVCWALPSLQLAVVVYEVKTWLKQLALPGFCFSPAPPACWRPISLMRALL